MCLVQEVLFVLGCEVILRTGLAAKRSAIRNLLKVVQATCNPAITIHVVSVKVDGCTAFYTGVHFGTVDDRVTVGIDHTRRSAGVGIDEVAVLVSLIIRTFHIAVTQRSLKGRKSRYGLAVAFQFGLTLFIGCLDGCFDFLDSLGIRLWNDEGNRKLRCTSLDCFGIPAVEVAENSGRACDNFCWIRKFCHDIFLHIL